MDSRSTATATYATTAPTPGPVTVSDWAMACTSLMPMATTSPAVTRRGSAAPRRVAWATVTRTVRKEASIRTLVIVRCRAMPSHAVNAPPHEERRGPPGEGAVVVGAQAVVDGARQQVGRQGQARHPCAAQQRAEGHAAALADDQPPQEPDRTADVPRGGSGATAWHGHTILTRSVRSVTLPHPSRKRAVPTARARIRKDGTHRPPVGGARTARRSASEARTGSPQPPTIRNNPHTAPYRITEPSSGQIKPNVNFRTTGLRNFVNRSERTTVWHSVPGYYGARLLGEVAGAPTFVALCQGGPCGVSVYPIQAR